MHCSKLLFSVIATATLCAATPVPQNANVPPSTESSFSGRKVDSGALIPEKAPGAQTDQALQKRQAAPAPKVTVLAGNGPAKLGEAAQVAMEIAAQLIKDLSEWNDVRETFTKNAALELWNRNPDYTKYHAAICYNKGYRLANPAGIAELASAKLEFGVLNTDYDCMLMEAPNQFFTDSEGGFINLAYRYDDRCTFDDATGDLTCT